MRSRERRACLAAIATQWHAPLAAHTSAARCGPPGPLSAAAGEGGIPANAIARGCRERRTCLAAIATHRWAGASGSHVSHPVRALCRPKPGMAGANARAARRVPVSPRARRTAGPALAAHVGRPPAPGAGPLRALCRPQPGRAESRRMRSRERRACLAAIATHRWRLTCGPPGAGPLPAAGSRSRGGRERTRERHGACLSRRERDAPLAAHVSALCRPQPEILAEKRWRTGGWRSHDSQPSRYRAAAS